MEKIKVAIVEQNNFHYEMILPILLPLKKIECEITIYCYSSDLGLKKFISDFFEIEYEPKHPDLIFEEYKNFDLLIFTTFPCYHQSGWKQCGCYEKILNFSIPKILFVHFLEIFSEPNFTIDFKTTFLFFVAPHGHRWFIDKYNNSIPNAEHFLYYPIFKMPNYFGKNKNQISITGQINYYRRDYSKILKKINETNNKQYSLYILGRCHDGQIDDLNNEIKILGLNNYVYTKSFIDYGEFYKLIQESEFTATALNKEKDRYFTNGLTASITAAISCGTICLVEPELFDLYPEFQSFFMRFDHFNFQKSTVIKFDVTKRNELLDKNYNILKQIISSLK